MHNSVIVSMIELQLRPRLCHRIMSTTYEIKKDHDYGQTEED